MFGTLKDSRVFGGRQRKTDEVIKEIEDLYMKYE